MNQERRKEKYEDYIADASPQAAAVGRREPYHLIYVKRYGAVPDGDTAPGMGQRTGSGQERGGSHDKGGM